MLFNSVARRAIVASVTAVLSANVDSASEAHGQTPERPVDITAKSDLPRGSGPVAELADPSAIERHPSVIFAEDFESDNLGDRWDERRNDEGDVLTLAPPPRSDAHRPATMQLLGRQSLRVVATLGKNTGGGLTKWFESSDRIYVRFYVLFDARCDYVHHFCTLRANKRLQGADRWSGFGGAGERPTGDVRFSTALEPWGDWGKLRPPGAWNFYTYWHQMQPSPDGRYWGNAFRPLEQPSISRNRWICAEFMLQHNTPGKPDGAQAYWIDGELRGHWTGFNWRTSRTLWANALTLESYVTDRWTDNSINVVYFDNVVIARDYVGPRLAHPLRNGPSSPASPPPPSEEDSQKPTP